MKVCACQQLKCIKVEADFSADPLWCHKCSTNLDSDDFALSQGLSVALYTWIGDYGSWIDWDTDGVVAGGVELQFAHNARGAELTALVKQELPQYDVVFSPSTYAVRNPEV